MIGQKVEHYRVLKKLGEGGMGKVYLAEDTSLQRKVALKFLPENLEKDRVAMRRFLWEARSAATLEHPFICNIKEVAQTDGEDITAALTVEGSTLGTPGYMSPEQIRAEPLDRRSDMFSFGIVLYEMVSGIHPFGKDELVETIAAILTEDPKPLSHDRVDLACSRRRR